MRPTLAIHGIWSRAGDLNWIEVFEAEARFELDVRPREYGFVSGLLTAFGWYRDRIVAQEVLYYKKLLAGGPPPNLVAHSFGGYVAWRLMEREGLRFHNVILLAPAAPAAINWRMFDDNFSRLRIYWSDDDEIIGLSPYGRMGRTGPHHRHPRVEAIATARRHGDHTLRPRFKEYIEFLRQEAA